jgi:ferredoxin
VAKDRIAYEFFGPATVLDAEVKPKPVAPTAGTTPVPAVGAITVEFRKSGIVAEWNASAQSLLAFAEDHGLKPEFSCRAGICGTCTSRIISGEVSYFEDPLEDLAQGELLLCCSLPKDRHRIGSVMTASPKTQQNPGAASAALMVNPNVAALPAYNAGMSLARARLL